jgi:hypothetical protein
MKIQIGDWLVIIVFVLSIAAVVTCLAVTGVKL